MDALLYLCLVLPFLSDVCYGVTLSFLCRLINYLVNLEAELIIEYETERSRKPFLETEISKGQMAA